MGQEELLITVCAGLAIVYSAFIWITARRK